MTCEYRESKHYSGDYLEVDIFPVHQAARSRGKKLKPSTEIQQRLNRKNAARRLTWLLQENFTSEDCYIGLSYPQGVIVSPKQAKKDLANWLRRVRYRFKKSNLELKYITATEIGKKSGRVHHHVICSGNIDRDELEKLWNIGYANSRRLQFGKTGLAGLAAYTVKDKDTGLNYRSYNCSKNLKKPTERRRDGRISGKKLKELRTDNYNAELFESLYPDYEFVDADPLSLYSIDKNGEAEQVDVPHITIRMFRRDSKYIRRDIDRM